MLALAIHNLRPNAKWILQDEDYNKLQWLDDSQSMPTLQEIEDELLKISKQKEKSLIPQTITLRQARLQLLKIELLDELENIISQNRAYQIEWEYANTIERTSPLVAILGVALNLDDEAIDNIFMEASKL